jgi:hypothetical protein
MYLVLVLALLTTMGIWALPWALGRRADQFRWWATLRDQMTSFWWGAVSIVSFAGVMIGGGRFGLPGAAVSSILLIGAFAWTFQSRFGSARRLQALCASLANGPPDTALRALEAELARHRETSEGRANGYAAWVQWTLHAAARASTAGYPADALRWTEGIDPRRVDRKLRCMHAQHAATFRLLQGDAPGARALLAASPRPAEPKEMELAIQALEGLLEAIDGDAVAALARADAALATAAAAPFRKIWLATRAHALVVSGAEAEARAVLFATRAEHGDLALTGIVRHRGPASAAAEAVLASQAPYR